MNNFNKTNWLKTKYTSFSKRYEFYLHINDRRRRRRKIIRWRYIVIEVECRSLDFIVSANMRKKIIIKLLYYKVQIYRTLKFVYIF